jgi:hypothetical protein
MWKEVVIILAVTAVIMGIKIWSDTSFERRARKIFGLKK